MSDELRFIGATTAVGLYGLLVFQCSCRAIICVQYIQGTQCCVDACGKTWTELEVTAAINAAVKGKEE